MDSSFKGLKNNLRIVTNSINVHNRDIDKRNTSGILGVHWDAERNKWRAKTWLDGKPVELGRFESKQRAAKKIEEFKNNLLRE